MSTSVAGLKVNTILSKSGVGSANNGDANGAEGGDFQTSPSEVNRLGRRMGTYRGLSLAQQQHFESTNEVRVAEQQKETMVLKQRHSESKTKKTTKKSEAKKQDSSHAGTALKRGPQDMNPDEEGSNKKRKPNSLPLTSMASATAIADYQIDRQVQNLKRNSPASSEPSTSSHVPTVASSIPTDRAVTDTIKNPNGIKTEEDLLTALELDFETDFNFEIAQSDLARMTQRLFQDDGPPSFNSILGGNSVFGEDSALLSVKAEPGSDLPTMSSPPTTSHTPTSKNGEAPSSFSSSITLPSSAAYPTSHMPSTLMSSGMSGPYSAAINKTRPNMPRISPGESPASQTLKQMAEQHQTKGGPACVSSRPNPMEFTHPNTSQVSQNTTTMSYYKPSQNMSMVNSCLPNAQGDPDRSQPMGHQLMSQGGPLCALASSMGTSRPGSFPMHQGIPTQQRPLNQYPVSQADSQNPTESHPNSRTPNHLQGGPSIPKPQGSSPLQSHMGLDGPQSQPLGAQSVLSPIGPTSQPNQNPAQAGPQHISQPTMSRNSSPGNQVNRLSPYSMQQANSFQPAAPGNSPNVNSQYCMSSVRGPFPNPQRGPSPIPSNPQGIVNMHQQKFMQQQRMMSSMGKPQIVTQGSQLIRPPPPEYRQTTMLQQQHAMASMNPGMAPNNFQQRQFRPNMNAGSMSMPVRMMTMNQQNMPGNMVNMKPAMMQPNMNMGGNMAPHMDQGNIMSNGMPGNMSMMNPQQGMMARGRTPNGPLNVHPRMAMQGQMPDDWKHMMHQGKMQNVRFQPGNPDPQMMSMSRGPSQMMAMSNQGMQPTPQSTNPMMVGMPGSMGMAQQRMKQTMGQNNQAGMNMQMGMQNQSILKTQNPMPNGTLMPNMANQSMQMSSGNMCMNNAANQQMPQGTTVNPRSPANMAPSPSLPSRPLSNPSGTAPHLNPSSLNRTNNPMMGRSTNNPGMMLNSACPNGLGSLSEIKSEPNQEVRYHEGSFHQAMS